MGGRTGIEVGGVGGSGAAAAGLAFGACRDWAGSIAEKAKLSIATMRIGEEACILRVGLA